MGNIGYRGRGCVTKVDWDKDKERDKEKNLK